MNANNSMGTMTMANYTADNVRDIIEDNIEDSTTPDAVLAAIVKNEGKKLTKRFLRDLPGGDERWYISTNGLQKIEELHYLRTGGHSGYSFCIGAWNSKVESINAEDFLDRNPSYYAGRIKRNNQRNAILGSDDALAKIVASLNDTVAAQEAYNKAAGEFESIIGELPDRSDIYKLLPGIE